MKPVTKRGQYLGEHSTSDASADVCLELTLRTSAGDWPFTGRCDPDGGSAWGNLAPKVRGPAPTSFRCSLDPGDGRHGRCSPRQTFDVTTGRGWELLWMRLERPGRSGGALQTPGPPTGKERSESLNGSGRGGLYVHS